VSTVSPQPRESLLARLVGGPRGFRELLERLGPTYMKIGQFLALRPDLIPEAYARELMRLLDTAPPFSWSEAKTIIAEDLGNDPAEIFAYINPNPVAAGSLAQTHVARLYDGTEVAVKVQRPGIRNRVMRDLGRARLLARLFELGHVSLVVTPRELVDELTGWMLEELDLQHELANMTRLYVLAEDSAVQRIPYPYPDLSGPRVLTAEYIRGVPFTEILLALRSGDTDELERVESLGIDLDRLAENLIEECLTQIFRYRFFDADIHPGNLIALPGERIGFVDFGLCDELDETVQERQTRYLAALYGRDVDQMFAALTELLVPTDETDMAAFRRDFSAETRAWLGQIWYQRPAMNGGTPPAERSPIGEWMVGVMRLARRHHLGLPPRILSMYRALLTAETLANQLGSDADLGSVGREFFTSLRLEQTLRGLSPDHLQGLALNLVGLVRDSPGQLHQILTEIADGKFELAMKVSEAPRTDRARNRRAQLVATTVLAVSVSVILAVPSLPSALGISLAWPLGILLVFLYAATALQWRRMR
jgi:ubiquinone biosynthesis protein